MNYKLYFSGGCIVLKGVDISVSEMGNCLKYGKIMTLRKKGKEGKVSHIVDYGKVLFIEVQEQKR